MPSDLMTLSLTRRTTTPANIDAVELRGIQTSDLSWVKRLSALSWLV